MAKIESLLKVVNNDTPDTDTNYIELNLLSSLVADYEEANYPICKPSLAEVLKLRMYELGLSQAQLAKKIGVSASRICEILVGKSEPTLAIRRRMSTELQIDPAIILGV